MEFRKSKIEIEDRSSLSPLSFDFILKPPNCSVSLQEFEDLAVARLKLLRIFERISVTGGGKDHNLKEWRAKIEHEISQAGLTDFEFLVKSIKEDDIDRARKSDHKSHYILRLAFCRTEDLRRWFVTNEVEFFRYKLTCAGDRNSIAKNLLDTYFEDTVTKFEGDRSLILQDLQDTYYNLNEFQVDKIDIYEVPFTHCLDLVKTRRVYLKGGKAYISHQHLVNIVCSEYRRLLSKDLATLSKAMHLVDEDERLSQILTDFDKRYTGSSYGTKNGTAKETITVETLEQNSTTSFPLCMKSLYDHVKKEYHLKHFGRLQLGLFFKGLGLPIEESTRFWRTYFTKKTGVDDTRFDKQYLYNIRHMYGKEGKRADYTPYSCMKIISSSVGPGENHGCPFRHADATALRVKLVEAGVTATGVKEIMELVDKHHYQIACQRYFEWTHNKATVDGGVNHPNQYYQESLNVLSGNFKIKTEAPKPISKKVSVYPKAEPVDVNLADDEIMQALEDPTQTAPDVEMESLDPIIQ